MIKIVSLFEEHIEKIILAVVGLVCLWLLAAPPIDPLPRVLFSPNVVSYDNRKLSPGTIDNYIGRQADLLKQKLNQPPSPAMSEPNKPALTLKDFDALLDSAVRGVDTGVYMPQPYISSRQRYVEREYHLPDIGEVNEAVVEHIRAVAYVPTEEITEENGYDKVGHEPNDIDLVTVQANFDVAGLYQRFHECFVSEDVPVEWRDPCLARPVFAAVQLQRQELNPDGSWSDWQTVPRIKIDLFRKLFEVIEDTDRLPPGGIKVRLAQFDNREVMIDLLQPPVYQIASPKEEWYPPSLHQKFADLQNQLNQLQNQLQIEEKRKAQEEKKNAQLQEQRTGTTEGRLGARSPGGTYNAEVAGAASPYGGSQTRTTRRSTTDRRTEGGLSADSGRLRDSSRLRSNSSARQPLGRDSGRLGLADSGRLTRTGEQDDRQTERERRASAKELSIKQAINELYNKRNSMSITPVTDLSKMREPLVFWAHDDTVEPGKTYQYRIRFGVFNPVAGAQQDKSHVKTILWSGFSSPKQAIQIPSVLYLFAKGIQETAKKVTVQVSKYTMGYWHSEDFLVGQGEGIGKPVESKPVALERSVGGNPQTPGLPSNVGQLYDTAQDTVSSVPETIDYGTGAILVDVVPVNDWSSGGGKNMLARRYFEMLYSFDGTSIEHTPVDMKYWSAELRTAYGEIMNLQKEPKEPLRAWGSEGTGFRRTAPSSPYGQPSPYGGQPSPYGQPGGDRRTPY